MRIQLLTGSESDDAFLGHTDDQMRPSSLTQAANSGEQNSCVQPGTMLQADSSLPVPSTGGQDAETPQPPRQPRGRRPISPVISNYFGLPTEREQTKSTSKTSDESRQAGDGLNFWGATNLVSKYTFLGSDTGSTDGEAEAVDDDQDSAEHSGDDESDEDEEEEEDEDEDEEDDDDSDSIELFGHR
ncbi:hypothetical protein Plec18170_005261 [Paecilomyces lecythidis]